MTLPGHNITHESLVIPRTTPTDTGTAFVVAKGTTSSTEWTKLQSLKALQPRTTDNATLYDAAEAAFRHGAKTVYYVTSAATDDELGSTTFATDLALFEPELGPGQVFAPGFTSTEVAEALLTHGRANNRRALIQLAGADVASIVTEAATLRALTDAELATYGAAFCQSALLPGIPALAVPQRTVPWTAVQAGLIARVDARGNRDGNPNVPAAGDNGLAEGVLGLDVEYKSATDRETLADAGVNVVRIVTPGDFPRTYDYVTLADPDTFPEHFMFNNVRLDMAIDAQAGKIAERFQFKVLDGDRKTVGQYGGELQSMLQGFRTIGALYADPIVDVGDVVNPLENLKVGKLSAVMYCQRAPMARVLELTHVTAPIGS